MARRYFAWRAIVEAEEAENRQEEHQMLRCRREQMLSTHISDTHFIQRYRLSKDAFEQLCTMLRLHTDLRSSQRVSLEAKVLSALLFYANGDYQRVVGMANNLSQEAVSRFIEEVTNALNHPNIIKKFICFPSTRQAREQLQQNFFNSFRIPGVVGCVDGCHFRIFKPNKNEEHLFYCRKHYHSLNVQMICDHRGKIISINAKFGGPTHDAFIWNTSNINSYMQTLHGNGERVWLLGDSGYPQRPWLMTPYSNPEQGSAAEIYNGTHCRTRVIIENVFGRLKNRWRCLSKDRVLHYTPNKCANIITACCVLHNLLLDFSVPASEEQILHDVHDFQRAEVSEEEESAMLTLGRLARDQLANVLYRS